MSWLRYSDDFTDWPEWDNVPPATRWAYLALVQACSRGKCWDGTLPKSKALAAVMAHDDEPQNRLDDLAAVSLVEEIASERLVYLPRIAEHVPPPGVRQNAENSKLRMRRKRAHDAGNHDLCLIGGDCPHAAVTSGVTPLVTRNSGTGRESSYLTYVERDRDRPGGQASAAEGDWMDSTSGDESW